MLFRISGIVSSCLLATAIGISVYTSDLSEAYLVAILTVITLSVSIMVQYFLGKITDRKERPPLIYLNRVMLSLMPVCDAFFNSLTLVMRLAIGSMIISTKMAQEKIIRL